MVEGESSTIFFVVVVYENVAIYSGIGVGMCFNDTGINNFIS
mgnify:CR=1 FL=1|tara:strand:- start:882 stop:1007 length:126 start_codon:yes stop_codon:yes gene_type:complete